MKSMLFCARLSARLLSLVLTALLLIAVSPDQTPAKEKVQIKILTAKFGGGSYIIGSVLAEMINKHSTSLQATAVETGGCTDNIKRGYDNPEDRKICIRDLDTFSVYASKKGIEPFDKVYSGLKFITFIFAPVNAMYTINPKIRTPQDLVGKTVCMGSKTGGIRFWSGLFMDYVWGLEGKYKKVWLGFDAANDNLLDGTIDATIGALNVIVGPDGKMGYKLHPSIEQSWIMKRDAHFISASREDYEKGKRKMNLPPTFYPYVVVPAGALGEKQTEAVGMGADLCNYAAYDMDDDVAYEICRIIDKYHGELAEAHNMGKGIHPKTMGWLMAPTEADVQPGALKYYREHNIPVYVGGKSPSY
jgi:TRAP transporter TAXI family solute receptor